VQGVVEVQDLSEKAVEVALEGLENPFQILPLGQLLLSLIQEEPYLSLLHLIQSL
jgi:hypothetical protein